MLVPFPAKRSRSVRLLACRTHRGFWFKGCFHTIWLPLNHLNSEWFVGILPILVGTRFVKSDANERRRPWCPRVCISNPAHIPSFEVLFAFLADRQTRVWELHVQSVLKPRRNKRQDVPM